MAREDGQGAQPWQCGLQRQGSRLRVRNVACRYHGAAEARISVRGTIDWPPGEPTVWPRASYRRQYGRMNTAPRRDRTPPRFPEIIVWPFRTSLPFPHNQSVDLHVPASATKHHNLGRSNMCHSPDGSQLIQIAEGVSLPWLPKGLRVVCSALVVDREDNYHGLFCLCRR